MSHRALILFAALGVLSLAVFLISLSRDWTREWHRYQQEYYARLEAMAASAEERARIRSTPHGFVQTVAGGARTDRCMTCHLAVEDPRFKDAPQPLRTHPEIPPHPFQRFGCSLCHGGMGPATNSKDAHGGLLREEGLVRPSGEVDYVEERVRPLLRGKLVYASCPACHLGKDRKGGRLLARGRALFRGKGCMGCHKIGDLGGQVGPELTFVGDKRTDPRWLLEHFRDPRKYAPGSTMPSYRKMSEAWLESLTAFMLSLRRAPYELVASVPLEKEQVKGLVEPPVKRGHWDAPERAQAVKNPYTATPDLLAKGRRLYLKYCASCHGEDGTGRGTGAPRLEPKPADFTRPHEGMLHPPGGTFWKIAKGRGLMPGWEGTFQEQEIWALAEYVRSFAKKPHEEEGAPHRNEQPSGGH